MISDVAVPHSPEAERAVLGGIIIDNGQLACAQQILGADDFFLAPHQRIFRVMTALQKRSVAIDPVTIKEELSSAADLQGVGGYVYIASLTDGLPSSANVEFYARIVKEKSEERRKVEDALKILSSLPSPSLEEDDVARQLRDVGLYDLGANASLSRVEVALRELRKQLNGIDPLRRALIRQGAIRVLGQAGIGSPAAILDAALGDPDEERTRDRQGRPLVLTDAEPWPDAVDGASLLNDLLAAFTHYVKLPPGGAAALALWTLHTYAHDAAQVSPILIVKSPTKRSGKTTTLTVLGALVRRPLLASNVTPAAIFRTVDKYQPTLLVDEADSFLTDNDELRGILNAGHARSGALVIRTVGEEHEPRPFSTWSPKAIASIGDLPGTLEDRAIVLAMRRKTPREKVARLRLDRITVELEPLRRKAARWSRDNLNELRQADPAVPDRLEDRAADNWRPLLAIADLCGGLWPDDARATSLILSGTSAVAENAPRELLLADLREIFAEKHADRLASEVLIQELTMRDDRPWSEWKRGKPLSPPQLARLLRAFGITPKQVWIDGQNVRGYQFDQFEDAFSRYLPPEPLDPLEAKQHAGLRGRSEPLEQASLAPPQIIERAHQQGVLAGLALPDPLRAGVYPPDHH